MRLTGVILGIIKIDCNGVGVVVVAARTDTKLSGLGDLSSPKLEFRQLVALLDAEGDEERDLKDNPLLSIQVIFPLVISI